MATVTLDLVRIFRGSGDNERPLASLIATYPNRDNLHLSGLANMQVGTFRRNARAQILPASC